MEKYTENPRWNMEKMVHIIIFICCLGSAMWFAGIQFYRYGKNSDLTVVSFKETVFDYESQGQPPTFTLCIMFDDPFIQTNEDPYYAYHNVTINSISNENRN